MKTYTVIFQDEKKNELWNIDLKAKNKKEMRAFIKNYMISHNVWNASRFEIL
jgi:hypothetical protein